MADVAESPQHDGEILKCTGSMVIEMLREALKAAEEWKAHFCDLMRTKEENKVEVEKLKKRVALLIHVNGQLFDKIAAQNKREALFLPDREKLLQDREKFLHEIHIRKKTKTLLIQERKEFFKKISGLKESERRYKEKTLNTTNSRRRTKAVLMQARRELVKTMDAQSNTVTVLLQERGEMIDFFSKKIRAQKKRESQLLQERKKGEVFANPMKISCREGLIDKILGRKERPSEAEAALRDESQTMERQPQTEHNILPAVELKDSEKKKARRKQNNPRRLETSPSPSPQETEVCRKRKRIEISPSSSSEEMKVLRSRRKPQRYGTSLPPPSGRIKRPRERKPPQRYRTSP